MLLASTETAASYALQFALDGANRGALLAPVEKGPATPERPDNLSGAARHPLAECDTEVDRDAVAVVVAVDNDVCDDAAEDEAEAVTELDDEDDAVVDAVTDGEAPREIDADGVCDTLLVAVAVGDSGTRTDELKKM